MNREFTAEWERWLATRPPKVQALAREFPIWTLFHTPQGPLWVVGYTDDDELVLTPADPREDYELALAERFPFAAQDVRNAIGAARHVRPN